MSAVEINRFADARAVADAVLYEGYVLYPYRASSRKNQMRWQFGVLAPEAFSTHDGSERWSMRTECLAEPGRRAELMVRIRCLQVQHRAVEVPAADGEADAFVPAERLSVDGAVHVNWDEAIDQVVELPARGLDGRQPAAHHLDFRFAGGTEIEPIRSADGALVGRIVRDRRPVDGRVTVTTSPAADGSRFVKVSVVVENTTDWGGRTRRDEVMGECLVAVHTMLAIDDGRFVSILDPPDDANSAAATCHSDGAFPVLIGADDAVVLASPIILYDHPEIAAESPGDLYDSTEIDEILALRVLTLTDAEKTEARGTDPRSAAIIDRCDGMAPETWERLHGTMRSIPVRVGAPAGIPVGDADDLVTFGASTGDEAVPWWDPEVDASVDPWTESVWVTGVEVTKGTAVVLRPSHRADAHDLFLSGLRATVAGVFRDVDGDQHVAVTVDDDPATEALAWQGRFLFFHPDEVEPVAPSAPIARTAPITRHGTSAR